MSMGNADVILPIENYDPFARFQRDDLRLSPVTFGLLVLLLDMIVDAWIGYRYNVWLSPADLVYPGLLQDFTALVVDFGSIPIIAGLYLWSTEGATRLFRHLQQSGVFQSATAISDEVDKSRPTFRSAPVFYIIAAVSVLYALSQLGAYQGWVPWESAVGYLNLAPTAAYYRTPFWLLNLYTLLFATFNVVITVITLRRLFRTLSIRILPLHPDKCGGLASISQYTVKVAYGLIPAGLVISAATVIALRTGTLSKAYPIILGIVAYLVLAPLLFFWPLGTAHTAMREAKDAQLLQLAQRFDDVYKQLDSAFQDEAAFQFGVKKLENLKRLYGIAQEFPVWPLDIGNLRRFFVVVAAPLVPAIVSIVIDLLTSFLSPG
jgi:hypothetical protein